MAEWHFFFSPSVTGIITGMIEGAIHGFVVLYVGAWLYNKLARR